MEEYNYNVTKSVSSKNNNLNSKLNEQYKE